MPEDALPKPVLEFDRVGFRYPGSPGPVLRGVTFALEPGTVSALVGPNGSGKSTLFRVAIGFYAPESGAVRLGGVPVARVRPETRARRLAYVPQRPELAFGYTAAEAVSLGGVATGSAARAALESVDLADRADDAFGALSAGQQQRVTLARALAQLDGVGPGDPDLTGRVLLADEPLAAQDPAHALGAAAAIRSVAARGAAALVAVHDLGAAARLADRVLVLNAGGTLVADAPPGEALSDAVLEPVFGVRFSRSVDADGHAVAITGVERADRR